MQDQLMILMLSAAVFLIIFKLYRQLLYITFNEDQARVSGLNVTRLNYLFIGLASLAVICITSLSWSSTNILINCDSKHYCDNVWKRI